MPLLLPTRLNRPHKHELYVKRKHVIADPLQAAVEVVGRVIGTAVVVANVVTVVAVENVVDRRRLEIKTMAKLRVKWVKSAIGYSKDQKATIRALGLHKLQQTVEHEDNPALRGMIRKVNHLVKVEEVVS